MELFVEDRVFGETRVVGHVAGEASSAGGGLAEVEVELGEFLGRRLGEVGAALFSPRSGQDGEGRTGRGGG